MKLKPVCLAGIAFMLFVAVGASAQKPYKVPEPVSQTKNNISICVHPQVELISVIQTIGNYPDILGFLMSKDSSAYKSDVNTHFVRFKEHPAVKMFDRLSAQPRMLNFSAPSNLMLYSNNRLQLRKDIIPDDFVMNRAGGRDSLVVFLELLRDFAIQSSFNRFYEEHREYYQMIIENTADNLGSRNYVSELENFYGKQQQSYGIVLVSLYNHVGFGNSLLHAGDRRDLYNTLGPVNTDNGLPFFGDSSYLKYMIRHEFSHPYINPLTEKYWDYIKDYASFYDSIPEKARKQVCGDWQECINEFIIRAVTTHLAYNESGETGKWAYEKEKGRGVSHLDFLLIKMNLYQANRDAWPTFEDYYLNLLDGFKEAVQ